MTETTRRPATVADIVFKLPHGGMTHRPHILASAFRHVMRDLTNVDDALATAIDRGMAEISHDPACGGLADEVWITDKGVEFAIELTGWDRALCPLAHTYDLFVPGLSDATTERTPTVDTLFPGMRAFPGSSIFAYHGDGDEDYCSIESNRVNALAQPQPEPEPQRGEVTGYVVVTADGAFQRSADTLVKDMEAAHYGADVDPREIVFVHLRGEYELHRVVFTSGGDPETDDRDYVHHKTLVRLADGPRVGMTVAELYTTLDGRA